MTSTEPDPYEAYLAGLHSELVTPDETIAEVIKEATGKDILSKVKIIAGEANEVYDCTLTDASHVILRISRNQFGEFKQEAWAMDTCRIIGVPVPMILLIRQDKTETGMISFCVMEKVDGEPLERGAIQFDALPLAERKGYIYQAGEILAQIHSVKTRGWGEIGQGGLAQADSFKPFFDNDLKHYDELVRAAAEFGFPSTVIPRAFSLLQAHREAYEQTPTCLNHADYSHKHFMVKDGSIVSIIDWGGVRSDSPMFDFANWDFWFGEFIPTQWLMDGYSNRELFDSTFPDRLHYFRLLRGMDVLSWYFKQKYEPAIRSTLIKIESDLGYFA